MRKVAYILSIVIGVVLIVGGIATWIVVSNTLSDQRITVSTTPIAWQATRSTGP